jgi:subtilase family serine protease
MEQKPTSNVSSESGRAVDSKKNLIIIIIVLAAAFVGLGALFIYKTSDVFNKTSDGFKEITESETGGATSSEPISDNSSASSATETIPAIGATETETTVQEEAKKADLYIKKYYFSEDPEMGSEFTITAVIGNKGEAASGEFYWEWWSNASKQVCKKKVGAIAPGGTSTVQCDYTYSSWSNYTTKIIADSQSDVDESNEGNNVATKQITPIHEKADLYITDYDFNHDPVMGEEFKVEITIKNKGETDAESFDWEWWSNYASSSCDGEVDELEAGESIDVSCKYTYGGWSTYATKAVVDVDDDVDESDEGNNTSTKTVIPIH